MRKMLLALLMLCVGALLPTLGLPAVHAKQPITLKSEVFIAFNWDWIGVGGTSPWTWIGTVTGDVNGDLFVSLEDAWFPGKTEKFSETWIIETTDGDLAGFDVGTWSFINFKFGANGKVTSATGGWSYLDGYDMRYSGTTTDPNVEFPEPITATGRLILSSK